MPAWDKVKNEHNEIKYKKRNIRDYIKKRWFLQLALHKSDGQHLEQYSAFLFPKMSMCGGQDFGKKQLCLNMKESEWFGNKKEKSQLGNK